MSTELEFNDIQGLILSAYAHLNEATYLFLGVEDSTKAKQWLKQLKGEISSAAQWPKGKDGKVIKPDTQTNIAFTYSGLAAFGLSQSSLETFSGEFRSGPIGPERSVVFGDIGESAPEHWVWGGPSTAPVHILLMLFADTLENLTALSQRHIASFQQNGIYLVNEQKSSRLPESKEHFGYRDGVSQPAIKGAMNKALPGQDEIAPGEFIFGYRNEYDLISPMPEPDPIGKNGTYLVFRQLAQDVKAFNDYLNQRAGGNPKLADYFGAKLVGRWKSGAPLALSPDEDNAVIGIDPKLNNNFVYTKDDPHGYHTPIGSHTRRSHPRDALEHDPVASTITTRRHRVLRRGRHYGPAYDDSTANEARGTLFIVINADIKRQFEFVQQTWINNPKFAALYNDSDPIAGDHIEGSDTATLQRWPIRQQLQGMPRFVSVKGSAYFFVPGLRAIDFIASSG